MTRDMMKDSPAQPHATGDGDNSNTTQPTRTSNTTRSSLSPPNLMPKGIKRKSSHQSLSAQLPPRARTDGSSSKNEPPSLPLQDGIEQLVEDDLYNFRIQRLEESNQRIFIAPMAKANLQARDDTLFSLVDKVKEFLASNREVMLILGDSGAGKSTFNRHLEHYLWTNYSAGGAIPLYINFPAIHEPEEDMVAKQLQIYGFEDEQIQEMKHNREFILLCDGYDESQLTTNLYTTNRLNQHGQWRAKMIVSCRTQFLGPSYLDQFTPQRTDTYQHPPFGLFQEAVIAPFSSKQVEDYITCYVPLEPRLWTVNDYMRMLTTIPNLMELVRNPFLLTLALETLPDITKGKHDISNIKLSRVQLYDAFVSHWLSVNKRRLESNTLLPYERDVFDQLLDAGFISMGVNYSTRLALAIFNWQAGNPVVHYVQLKDQETWKAEFFGLQPEVKLLRESSPLIRTGEMFRFIHRSMLEYFFSRAIYNPVSIEEFDIQAETEVPAFQPLGSNCPLFQRDLLKEPSVIQFLCDRVKLHPTFEQQLHAVIDQSKTDASATTAASNAITILVRAGVSFHGTDLRGIKIPGADLSDGQFDSAQLQGAGLTRVNLARTWLRKADFSGANMEGVTFGELPYLEMETLVSACSFSPNSRMLGAADYRGVVYIYDASSYTRMHRLEGHDMGVNCVVFSPDSQRLASGSLDSTVRLWDSASGEMLLIMEGHQGGVYSAAVSPCGSRIASASMDDTVRLWDAQTGECFLVLKGHTLFVNSVKFSPDGQQVISGSTDKTIRFWNSETGEPGHVLSPSLGNVVSVAYSPDGRWVAVGHKQGHFQLWDAVTLEPGPVLIGHTSTITGIDFSPNGQWIASSSEDRTVRLWDASTGTLLSIMSHTDSANDVSFSPDSRCIASTGHDKKVRLWEVSSLWSGAEQHVQPSHVFDVKYSVDGQNVLSCSKDTVQQWDSLTGVPGPAVLKLPNSIASMSFSPDGRRIVAGDYSGSMKLWNLHDDPKETLLPRHVGWFYTPIYSSCGRWIVSRGSDKAVRLWDLYDLDQEHTLTATTVESNEDPPLSVIFSPTGSSIAVGYSSGTIRIFDPCTRDLLKTKKLVDGGVVSLAYSPSGLQIAMSARSGTIYLWDLHYEKPSTELKGHVNRVNTITYSTCGQWIASGCLGHTIRLWHRQQHAEDESWSCAATVQGFLDAILKISWNPAKPLELATACMDGSVRVWRISNSNGNIAVSMLWGSSLRMLCTADIIIKDTIGLSITQQQLLLQRGTISGYPQGRPKENTLIPAAF